MLKKLKRSKVFAVAMASSLMLMLSSNAFAANYTAVTGTSCNFNKYLIMDAGDSVPNATFAFTVSPGTAIAANPTGNVMEVMAGVGTPTIANVVFSNSDTTATSAGSNIDVARTQEDRTGTAGTDTVQLDSGEKYATKQATVDFSGVSFTEPGIYRYVITETASAEHAAAGIVHDTDTDRILDVYVTDNGSGTLVVSEYVLHTTAGNVTAGSSAGSSSVSAAGDALDDKTDGFTNEYTTKDLRLSKSVSGNQASRDKYFELTATVSGVNDNDTFVVSIADDSNAATNDGNADATSGDAKTGGTIEANAGKTNPTSVTGAQLKAGVKFYMQDGQNVVIRGIAPNATYAITENAEDYKSEVMSGKTNSGAIGTVAGSGKIAEAGFTNTKDGIIPTGMAMTVGAGALILAFGLAILFFVVSKRRMYEN